MMSKLDTGAAAPPTSCASEGAAINDSTNANAVRLDARRHECLSNLKTITPHHKRRHGRRPGGERSLASQIRALEDSIAAMQRPLTSAC